MPNQLAYIFLKNGETQSGSLTYGELDKRARAIASHLQSMPGERALLLYPSGLKFISAFMGCLYAGVVAVPVYPPRRNQKLSRLLSIVNDAQACIALTTTSILADLEQRWASDTSLAQLKLIATDTIVADSQEFAPLSVTGSSLAFLQYTSGSTGTPKGVMVSHGNLIHNSEYIKQAFELTSESRSVTWLPNFHDMGLIDGVLQPLYAGFIGYIMPPIAFIQKPIRWLQAICRYKATHCGGPNFAYDLCVRKVTSEQLKTLDLSSWYTAYNGAEPVRNETLNLFVEKFKHCGFKSHFFYPCYGMAETTLFISGGLIKSAPIVKWVQTEALEENKIVDAAPSSQGSKALVGCGHSWLDLKIVIVHPESFQLCEDGQVGEIWVSSVSVTKGYWNRPEATQSTFQAYLKDTGEGPFFRTGDLGFFSKGELFVTGRLKDLIIIRGRNHYPQDIELTVENSHPSLRSHGCAAFSVERDGEERLVVACEVERTHLRKLNTEEVVREIKIVLSTEHELDVDEVVLLKTGSIPKTSSGKIQHRACKQGLLEGSLNAVGQWKRTPETTRKVSSSSFIPQDDSSANPSKTVAEIEAWLINKIAELLQIAPEKIDSTQPLAVYGLNSVLAVSIAAELEEWLGMAVVPTIVYDYPSIQALADYLGQTTPSLNSSFSSIAFNPATVSSAIAIIGKGCRFPKANNPEAFWSLLRSGQDGITKVPVSRWESDNGWGGFLEQVDQFDAQFFNISPRETNQLDPQQRLLLEVSWEALENAGLAAAGLAGSRSGVFIGISSGDYAHLSSNLANTEAYYGTGNALSIAANRLSYVLDWHGPSWAVDTACSSSLVAVHQASQSLWNRECNLALAGGVNLMLTPQLTRTFSLTQMMAADGRCKTFDATADGYVRSEGCGVVVLKRLDDALADGDHIQAIIRGSAVNQDGLTNGLTAPNCNSQQEVIRLALAKAGVKPNQISYVETHGTGTSLGDPIEVNSLKAVLMEGRQSNQPCWIGSVKTNIGHLEAAAGIAGLIKSVLCLEQGEIPPHLHLKQLNPYIELENTAIEIPTQLQLWSSGEQPRLAGVSAFGFGGTNAHVIVEEAPGQGKRQKAKGKSEELSERTHQILTLSAKSEKALLELAQSYQKFLGNNSTAAIADICFTANTGRNHFSHRLAIVTSDKKEAADKLAKISAAEESNGVFSGQVPSNNKSPKIAFLFTGQGSQYINMGRELYQTQPVFRRTLDQCEQIIQSYLEKSILDVIYPENTQELNSSLLDQTAYTQPALFAIEYALFQLWQSWGIQPDVVMGHSVGEYVAATIAGVFSLEDGLKLIAHRGRLMQQLSSGGEMVAVMASYEKVNQLIAPYSEQVAIAAINGPVSTVVSGAAEGIKTVKDSLEAQGIKTKQLQVSHAFHSPLMEPMLAEFEEVASQITYNQPTIPLISNVTGAIADESIATASYWVNHVCQPVKFAQSMETLQQLGYDVFLEIGSKAILLGMAKQCLPEGAGVWLPSLRPGQEDWQQMLQSLAQLYVRGVKVDWLGFDNYYSRSKVVLPTYPFQRQRYWIETDNQDHKTQCFSKTKNLHPLLGQRFYSAVEQKEILFDCQISASQPTYLKHHCVCSQPVLPATAYLEIALAAGSTLLSSENLILEDVFIQQGLILPEDEIKTIQVVLTPQETLSYNFEIFSLDLESSESKPRWTLHAEGKFLAGDKNAELETTELKTLKGEYNQQISVQDFYQEYRERGIDYGYSFQAVQELWSSEGKALGQIQLPETLVNEATLYQLHPVLLDASFQVLGATLDGTENQDTYLPVAIKRLEVYRPASTCLWSQVEMDANREDNSHTLTGEVRLLSDDGKLIATVEGLTVKRATAQAIVGRKQESVKDWLYKVEWRPKVRFGKQLSANYLPTPDEIDLKLRPQVTNLIGQPELEVYKKLLNQLETLSIDYVLKAFQELGWEFVAGEFFSTEFIVQKLGVVQPHQRLLGRLLEMLSEVGILKPINGEWEVTQVPLVQNPQQRFSSLLTQYPRATAELTLLSRCASQLASVLRGESDPVQLVFPQGDLTTATELYQESPGALVMNTLVQQAVLSALEKLPKSRGVRVLEIGAGTGGTTAHVLPHLNQDQTEYVFTDVGALFTTKAQEKFGDYPFVGYQTLDIEKDPYSQGFEEHQYDLIIAANVLHATQDLRQILQNVQQLLAPQGMLVLLEGTTRQRWLDLIFGLLEGWWRFTDVDLRPNYPLISARQWQQLLLETGFQQAVSIPDIHDTSGALSEQAVILAQAKETTLSNTLSEQKSWLILADQQGIAQQLAAQLQSIGDVCILVKPGKEFKHFSQQEFTINPNNPPDFEQLLLALPEQLPNLNVVQCWSIDEIDAQTNRCEDLQNAPQRVCGTTLSLVQALVKVNGSQPPRLWLVTTGAQPVPNKNPVVPGIVQSSLWGMGKVIALEHPELKCVRVDLDPKALVEQQAMALWKEICSEDVEDQVAIRKQERYVPRLVRHHHTQEYLNKNVNFESKSQKVAPNFCEDGTYLITGGLGGLGLLVARWMVKRGARHLALVGRSGASDAVQTQLKELERSGAKVVVYRADVSEVESIAQVLSQIERSLPPLRGIIHSVGVLDDGILLQQTWEKFARVMAPKVQGAWNLHNLTVHEPIDFFVLFSSAASLLGSPGQANHSAANAFLDALAYYRQSMGLPGLSINWGAVAQIGAAAKGQADERAQKKGVGAIRPHQVTEALELLMSNSSGSVGVVPIRWPEFIKQWSASPFFADFIETSLPTSLAQPKRKAKDYKLNERLEASSSKEREKLLITHLQSEVAQVLKMTAFQIDVQQPLNTMGLDSLMAVELRNRLQSDLGVDVPIVKFIEDISIVGLATEVNGQLTQIDITQKVEQDQDEQTLLSNAKDSDFIEGEL
ncbi:MAG: SDR family NAD(P)-dependent oxidoreductase [Moorea sp. SIO4A3]|nr:SDR family NAD(P)-dependent oxidoreductase [Moorena sp. SIO4A3]